jgi:hypothetical protein
MVEPNIIKTKYYTLVSADTGHGKTLWCKKKVARLLRTTQDRIIVIDVTGKYADFVLDHDRIVPGHIPMVMHQYKLSGGWPVDAHIIEVDMPINRQPQLIVYDVSRTMGTWHRGVLAISDALLGYMTGRENTTTCKKKCKEHKKSQGRAIYIPNGNPKKAFFSEEDHPITLGRLVPIFMLVGIAVLYFTITKTMQMLVIIRTAPIGSETMIEMLKQFQ